VECGANYREDANCRPCALSTASEPSALSPLRRGGGLPSVTKAKGYGKVGASEDAVEVRLHI
jgi:hypothetical protein